MTTGAAMNGGCLCGELRYVARPNPETAYICHCRDCQIGSASAFLFGVQADRSSFNILSGETTIFPQVADSGNKWERVFCPKCGTPVYWTGEKYPEHVILSVTSLDEPQTIEPVHELWVHRALPWLNNWRANP